MTESELQASTSGSGAETRRRPLCFVWSAVFALMLWPLLWAIDRGSGGCADGLCGFFPGVAGGSVLLLTSIGLAIAGLTRRERPRWLLLIPLLSIATLYARLSGLWPFGYH